MKGAVRVAVLIFTALQIQRVLLWIGGGLIGIGCLFAPPGGLVGALFGGVLALVPFAVTGGLLLRHFVAPRTLRLIPHSREQILGGMLLATIAIATVAALLAWRFGGHPVPVGMMAATAASLVLLTQFSAASGGGRGMTIWIVVSAGVMQAANSPSVRGFVASTARSPVSMSAILIVLWMTFGIWFLRRPAFGSPSHVQPHGSRIFKVETSQATAIRTFLMGNPSTWYQYSGGLLAVLLIAVGWGLMNLFLGSVASFADAVAKGAPAALGIAAYAGIAGFLVVGRSKFLWLRGPLDRMGLFALCERQAWRFYRATNVSVVALFLFMSWTNPALVSRYAVMLLFHLSAGACVLYLGLMHVRGWRALDVLCTFGMIILWVIPGAMISSTRPWSASALVHLFAVMAGVALGFRLIALHRWRNIDWLECKPPRPVARGVQQAHSA